MTNKIIAGMMWDYLKPYLTEDEMTFLNNLSDEELLQMKAMTLENQHQWRVIEKLTVPDALREYIIPAIMAERKIKAGID